MCVVRREKRIHNVSMTIIKRSALLPYLPQQMFDLVNAIEEYPHFLPWCYQSHVLHRDEKEIEAELELAWSGIHKSFTTRNQLTTNERIDITLIKGPFHHLEGIWTFAPIGDHGCKIHLERLFFKARSRSVWPISNKLISKLLTRPLLNKASFVSKSLLARRLNPPSIVQAFYLFFQRSI